MRLPILFRATLLSALLLSAIEAWADLGPKQARKLIANMAGFELSRSAVRVKGMSKTGDSSAEVNAEIEIPFRLGQDQLGRWRVAEIRTGPNQWEGTELIANALKADMPSNACNASAFVATGADAKDPSVTRARCLIASLFSVQLPSDAVRIKDLSSLNLPLASNPSALVVAVVRVEVRFVNDNKTGWHVSALRTGSSQWLNLEKVISAVNEEKKRRAQADLEAIARALEAYRTERGMYLAADKHAVLMDHLTPRYLSRVIRLDPWHRPYRYQGESSHFLLRSPGPDGKENTADDIVLASPSR
jgi:hypothetical protein